MPFLDLPYDIRHQIYAQLFPHTTHLYLHTTEDGVTYIPSPDCAIPLGLLGTCKALHEEASEYLYNEFLFDVVGKKLDCLEHYEMVHMTIQKYARERVYVRALSNGSLSSTGCISVFTGAAKLAIVERRQRGYPTTVEELRKDDKVLQEIGKRFRARHLHTQRQEIYQTMAGIGIGALALLAAWLVATHVMRQ